MEAFFNTLAVLLLCIFIAPIIIYTLVKVIVIAFYNAKQQAGQQTPKNGDKDNGEA